MNERLILVTNDDGYDSKGMEAAIEVARAFGRVVVVAPETTQSGMSQAITMYNPLYLRRAREEEGLEIYALPAPHPRGGGRRGLRVFGNAG